MRKLLGSGTGRIAVVVAVFVIVFAAVFAVRVVSSSDDSGSGAAPSSSTTHAPTAPTTPADQPPSTTPADSTPAPGSTAPAASSFEGPPGGSVTSADGPTWIPPTGIVNPESPNYTPTAPPTPTTPTFTADSTVYATSGETVQPPIVTTLDPKRPSSAPTSITPTPPPAKPGKATQATPAAAAAAWLQAACFWSWKGGQDDNRTLAAKYMVDADSLDSRWVLDDRAWAQLQHTHVSSGCVNIKATVDKDNPHVPKGQRLVVVSAIQVLSGDDGAFQSLPVSVARFVVKTGGKWLVGEVSTAS